jgi:Flp pilus assembly protein TadG
MRILAHSRHVLGFGRRLARDENGAALIYVSIALTVFMGFAALVVDGSRLFTLDTELQSAADAIALAGAAELDGNADAQTRADAAMAALVQNSQTFGTGAAAITGFSRRFLDELPDDDQPITADFVAADAPSTRFVEVTINERQVDSMFATAVGGDDTAGADAVAVAGFTSAVCKFTPLFICNPYEGTDSSLAYFSSQVASATERRKIIALKKSGSGASLFPGNFGFLESGLGPGANELKDSLASVDPGSCFRQDGVETQTGAVNSARHAINTRFDIYEGNFNGKKNNANYRPAENVTKGYLPTGRGGCNSSLDTATPPTAMGFPSDAVIGTNRLGNGNWDFEAYWNINHPGVTAPNSWDNSDANRPSRYDVYQWELANEIPDNSATGGEDGNPTCSSSTVLPEPDRRILYAAVLNCDELDLTGGSADTVPALTFIKMFITQPMTKLPGTGLTDEDDTLYVEMVDIVQPGVDDEVVHDIVQLYR